jgi:aldose sugar dehydrogenase
MGNLEGAHCTPADPILDENPQAKLRFVKVIRMPPNNLLSSQRFPLSGANSMSRLVGILVLALSLNSQAEIFTSAKESFALEVLHQGSDVVWGFDFLNEREILLTERGGGFYHLDLDTGAARRLEGAPEVRAIQQGGLLDLKIHRTDDADWVYMTYSEDTPAGVVTSLGRGSWVNGNLENFQRLFQAKNAGDRGLHFGSRIVIDGSWLYMTIGDRIQSAEAQNLNNHNGTVVRLNLDGTPAAGNPFVGRGLPEIWTYGHRSPQGIDIHPETGQIYQAEMGPLGGDEINLLKPGANYGWPVIGYGRAYSGAEIHERTHAEGMEQPVIYFVPSPSPSGIGFYRGDKFPGWRNHLFMANLGGMRVIRLEIEGDQVLDQETLLDDQSERFRQVRSGPDGYLYFSTDSGKILRLVPATVQ